MYKRQGDGCALAAATPVGRRRARRRLTRGRRGRCVAGDPIDEITRPRERDRHRAGDDDGDWLLKLFAQATPESNTAPKPSTDFIREGLSLFGSAELSGDYAFAKTALQHLSLQEENAQLRASIESRYEIVGKSFAIRTLMGQIEKVAPTPARVLITGDNGTGKELVARAIHRLSPRLQKPFIEVNCAAIPSELIESELFGHMKGSFTGAIQDRAGKFEQADKGTLFLDEIGDMSPSAQAKV